MYDIIDILFFARFVIHACRASFVPLVEYMCDVCDAKLVGWGPVVQVVHVSDSMESDPAKVGNS